MITTLQCKTLDGYLVFKVNFLQIQIKFLTVLLHEEVSLKTPNARAMLSGQSPSETIDGGQVEKR